MLWRKHIEWQWALAGMPAEYLSTHAKLRLKPNAVNIAESESWNRMPWLNVCTIAKAVNKKIKASSEWKLSAAPHAIHRLDPVAAKFPIALGFTAGLGRFSHLWKLGFWRLSRIPVVCVYKQVWADFCNRCGLIFLFFDNLPIGGKWWYMSLANRI